MKEKELHFPVLETEHFFAIQSLYNPLLSRHPSILVRCELVTIVVDFNIFVIISLNPLAACRYILTSGGCGQHLVSDSLTLNSEQ